MPGFFYPPPPSQIGGAQPYAPRLGIVQSGPTPQAPPIRGALALANLALIVSCWNPQPVQAQPRVQIAPLIPVVQASTQVPYSRTAIHRSIIEQWNTVQLVVLGGNQIAPLLATPPQIDNPPPSTTANLNLLVRSWTPPDFQAQGSADVAPTIPAVVVTANPAYTRDAVAISAWAPPLWPKQYRPFIASLPIVNDPPRPSWVNAQVVLQSWVPPWYPPQGFSKVAPLVPRIDSPPVLTRTNFDTINVQWRPPYTIGVGYGRIAQLSPPAPVISQPPVVTRVNQQLITQRWDIPRWWPLPALTNLAQSAPGYTEDTRVIVPYLIQDTPAQAEVRLASVYLTATVIGSGGTVQAQDIVVGTLVERHTSVTITMGGPVYVSPRGGRGGLPPYTLPS